MSSDTEQPEYRCLLYLKDEQDQKCLAPDVYLYGEIVHSTKMIFMTPYLPPANTMRRVAVVRSQPGPDHTEHSMIILSRQDTSWVAEGLIETQYLHLPAEFIYMSALYERTPFQQSELDVLWNSTVTIIGCGTGGSKIALELTRAGVGHLKLCDFDTVSPANISRYEGDLLDVGKSKVHVAAERVYRINPAIKLQLYAEDIFERPLDQLSAILTGDLIIAATDKHAIQLLINELAHRFKIPCVFGGCYEEALGGEVFFTLPGERMPCLACLRSGLKQPEITREIDYSTATGPEDYEGQPGLHAAVDFVTCVEAQICLGVLLRDSPTSALARLIDPRLNFILIGSALAKGFYRFRKPFDIFFQPLSGPRAECPVCSRC